MIDDLVSVPFTEPYRMLTARAEYRLSLRTDTAADRFRERACRWQLIDDARCIALADERAQLNRAVRAFDETSLNPNSAEDRALQEIGQSPIGKPMSLAALMRRPSLSLAELREALPALVDPLIAAMQPHVLRRFEDELKYAAFVAREQREVTRTEALAERSLPDTDCSIPGLRHEARQQIERHRPRTFGEAQRIAGITAADISALLIHATRLEHAQQ
jgi:tRNA uridine 5-carboxymethylaminomethyl modification enzyme